MAGEGDGPGKPRCVSVLVDLDGLAQVLGQLRNQALTLTEISASPLVSVHPGPAPKSEG